MAKFKQKAPFPLRLKDDLEAWLKGRAVKQGNSLNKEISILLTAVKGQMERQQENAES